MSAMLSITSQVSINADQDASAKAQAVRQALASLAELPDADLLAKVMILPDREIFFLYDPDTQTYATRSSGFISRDELAKTPADQIMMRDLVCSFDEGAPGFTGVWVRSDLVGTPPVLADLHSDDYIVQREIDIRPALLEACKADLAGWNESGFEDEEYDHFYHDLELRGDPAALALADYLSLSPTMGFKNDPVGFGIEPDLDSYQRWYRCRIPDAEGPAEPA